MKNCVVEVRSMPFSEVLFFLHVQLEQYNVMNFEFSLDDDCEFINLVSKLKGWYSAYIIQKSESNYLKVTFVTKVSPLSFVHRISSLTSNKKGGINYV